MNINNYSLDKIEWDTFVEDYEFVHNNIYRGLNIEGANVAGMERIWEIYLQRTSELFDAMLLPYYEGNSKLPETINDIFASIFVEVNLNRTVLHEIVIKIRDCKTFDEYKKLMETDGLNLISELAHKRVLKRIMPKDMIPRYQDKVTYLASVTLFPMYLNRGILPEELNKILSKELRYDYVNFGYPLFECPVMAKALLGEFSYNVNETIDIEVSKNHKFPEEIQMNPEFHKVLLTGNITNLERYRTRYNIAEILCKRLLEYFDRFTLIATTHIDNIISNLDGKYEIDTNGFLDRLIPTIKGCKTREEMIERVVDLEDEYLFQADILRDVIDGCDDIFKIVGLYVVSLMNSGTKSKKIGEASITYKSFSSSDRNEIVKTCEHLFEFKDFLLEYLLQSTFNVTIHSDNSLSEYIIDVINHHCDILNIESLEENENIIETVLARDLEVKFRDKYRDLNNIAEENGFVKIRQKGDHGIFKKNDGSTIVIPQGRRIGKGLSLKIQKDIKCI